MNKSLYLAPDPIVIYKSPSPHDIYTYSPGILVLDSGRLVCTFDLGGPGAQQLPGSVRSCDGWSLGKIYCSDDGGKTWVHSAVLHFSKNLVDWCFAGIVDAGETQRQARHYGAMAIDGDDLLVVSRSGDEDAYDAHDTDIITLHRIGNFRSLVY